MAAITFSGLSSGIDSASLISKLVSAEKQPEVQLQSQQSDLASQKRIVDQLSTQVAALGSLVGGMTLATDVQYRTATATDNHVTVAASGDASATSHDVRVLQTANAQVSSSKTFASNSAGILGVGSLSITTGTGAPATVSWDGTDTLSTIASKINDANAGVSASVLFDGTNYRLMLTANQTGTANAATFSETGAALGMAESIGAKDAIVSIDNVPVTRSSNVISDALPGLTITAVSKQAATDPDTTVTVAVDHDAAAKQLDSFVSAYNAIIDTINQQLTYTGTTAGTDTLFGDSTLRQLKQTMDDLATQTFGSMTMADLGMTYDKTGVLSLDRTKLDTALDANGNAIANLFVTGGMSAAFKQLSTTYTEAGDGILATKSAGYTTQTQQIQSQIDEIDQNANELQTRLQNQFTALEQTMSTLNSQTTYISKILAG